MKPIGKTPVAGVALAVCISLCCCDDENGTGPEYTAQNTLVFTREDMSVIDFPPTTVTYIWCGDWEPGEVAVPALHVWVGTPGAVEPHWLLRAVVRDVTLGEPLSFPNYFVWNQPDSAHIFVFDPPNELATNTEESRGTITFHKLPCPVPGWIDFSIDAVVGSEYGDMPSISVRGRFSGRVMQIPASWTAPSSR